MERVNDGKYLLEKVAAFSLSERLKFEFVFLRKENISVALEFIFVRVCGVQGRVCNGRFL